MAIISGDGPDKRIGQHGAWSVTFSCTRVTLLSLLSCHRDALMPLKDKNKVLLHGSWGWETTGISTYSVKRP